MNWSTLAFLPTFRVPVQSPSQTQKGGVEIGGLNSQLVTPFEASRFSKRIDCLGPRFRCGPYDIEGSFEITFTQSHGKFPVPLSVRLRRKEPNP